MKRTHDYLYPYRGRATATGRCRVRVYEQAGQAPVVIVTDLRYDDETNVTRLAEYLAAEIIAQHFPERFEDEQPVRWIENHERNEWELRRKLPEFLLVEFSSYTPRPMDDAIGKRVRIGAPRWTRLSREAIERIIGQPLE